MHVKCNRQPTAHAIGDRILRLAPVTNLQTSISSCTLQPARLINLRVPLLPRPPACAEGRFFRFSRSLHPYGLRLGMNLRFRSFTPSSGLRLRTLLRASPELVSSGQVGSDSPTSIEYSSLACTSDEPSGRILCPMLAHRVTAIHLGLPSPAGSSGLPAGIGRAALDRLRGATVSVRSFLTLLRVGFT